MHFASEDTIRAPAAFIFGQMADLGYLESVLTERGAEVTRLDMLEQPGIGVLWEIRFALRGRRRKIDLKITDFVEPKLMQFTGLSEGIFMVFRAALEPVDENRTRLATRLELKPRTLAGRMLLQSARLTKLRLNRGYKQRMADYARRIEQLAKDAGGG
jgi:hypothetical protein